MIPNNYSEWKFCIERDCGIKLTAAFAHERLQALADRKNPHTDSFIKCYGMPYYQKVVKWFQNFLNEKQVVSS
jgi:hypothetical protein